MDDGGRFTTESSPTDVITLMQVSHSISNSSTSSDQSKSIVTSQENSQNLTNNIAIAKWRRILGEIEWNKYVRWDLLLVFGFTLWLALCIADLLYPKPIYIIRDKDKLSIGGSKDKSSRTAYVVNFFEPNFFKPCFFETFLFITFIGFFAYAENRVVRKWWNYSEDSREIKCGPLVPIYHEKDFLFDDFDDSTDLYNDLEYPEEINCIKVIAGKKLQIHPELYWHWKLFHGIAEVTTKRKSKRFNKLGIHNSELRSEDYLVKYGTKNEKYDLRNKLKPCETYDQEIQRFIETKRNESTSAFEEIVDFRKEIRRNNYSTWQNYGKISAGIISSSPDFQEFLARYKIPPITQNPYKKLTF